MCSFPRLTAPQVLLKEHYDINVKGRTEIEKVLKQKKVKHLRKEKRRQKPKKVKHLRKEKAKTEESETFKKKKKRQNR